MLPMSVVVGVVVGATFRRPLSVGVATMVLIATSIAWGLVVGIIDGSASTGLAGTLLACANTGVGFVVAMCVRRKR